MTGATLDDLLHLERQGWKALAAGEAAAAEFFDRVLDRQVLMVLPGGLVIDDRQDALDAITDAPPWDDHELSHERVVPLGSDTAAVVYRATARRGERYYTALFSSVFSLTDQGWRLVLHQQTPFAIE